jgi:hypothetical protein
MASLYLSAKFDVVNVKLLLKLLLLGISEDLISLVSEWLSPRYIYFSIDGNNSSICVSGIDTVQGSILGLILYTIYVSPQFDLENITKSADGNHVIRWDSDMDTLIFNLERDLEMIRQWLIVSGFKVNETKKRDFVFHRSVPPIIIVRVGSTKNRSKPSMNVPGMY